MPSLGTGAYRHTMKLTNYRKLEGIDHLASKEDLQRLSLVCAPGSELRPLVDHYCTDLSLLLGQHAPLKGRVLRIRPQTPPARR